MAESNADWMGSLPAALHSYPLSNLAIPGRAAGRGGAGRGCLGAGACPHRRGLALGGVGGLVFPVGEALVPSPVVPGAVAAGFARRCLSLLGGQRLGVCFSCGGRVESLSSGISACSRIRADRNPVRCGGEGALNLL